MSHPVIQVQGLGKEYVIGGRESGRETFREMLTSSFAAPFRRLRRLKGDVAAEERIWALKDVSFEVAEGEVVGIIGRNGAGKSTLLKILSRITDPTEGRVEIRGRVASLLEVGTGFHPELTGRENTYLNGAILGMSRAEIDRKFDEIVAFAEVEQFLDTPVKRYSSGMQVRLAFAVAAHLEPEILVVDEVLAVGDAAFQKKCLGKMEEVSGEGRTVLFVSHNMAMIERLCERAMTLRGGRVVFEGSPFAAIQAYYRFDMARPVASYRIPETVAHNRRGRPTIFGARVVCEQEVDPGLFPFGASLTFEVLCKIAGGDRRCGMGIGIDNGRGVRVTTLISDDLEQAELAGESGEWFLFVCRVDEMLLAPGEYHVKLSLDELLTRRSLHTVESAFQFDVATSDYPGVPHRRVGGVVLARQEWDLLKGASPEDLQSMSILEI